MIREIQIFVRTLISIIDQATNYFFFLVRAAICLKEEEDTKRILRLCQGMNKSPANFWFSRLVGSK